MAKNALGKGLGALLSENEVEEEIPSSFSEKKISKNDFDAQDVKSDGSSVFEINLDEIKANPYQPRKEFSEDELSELADSIKEHGVIEPIIVTKNPDGGFIIVGGERRTRASRLAGLKTIPAVIKEYTPQKMLEIALIENIQREDLNALEEALAYQQLMEMANLSQEDVAKRVGKKRSTVANSLRLLKLPVDMQRALTEGRITAGHARAILSVINPSDQQILYARIIGNGLSVRDAEQMAGELNGGGKAASKSESKKTQPQQSRKDPDLFDFEQKLIGHFGTKVQINGTREKGVVQIEYLNSDDLDRLYSLLLGE